MWEDGVEMVVLRGWFLPWVAFCAFVAFAPPTAYILLLGEE